MCTVSFIPFNYDKYCLTSNRDELSARPTLPPQKEKVGNVRVTFPKDEKAGGTWVAVGDDGRVCCLLNGAFVRHERQLPYRLSRGKILLSVFEYESIQEFSENVNLSNVEPFTLVMVEPSVNYGCKLIELRWDSKDKYIKELDSNKAHIWSSATLYEPELRSKKEDWFSTWLLKQEELKEEEILKFHAMANGQEEGKRMVLGDVFGLQTVSITQVSMKSLSSFKMKYQDLLQNKTITVSEPINRGEHV